MPWQLPRPRFGLRTLLVVVFICAVGLALYTSPGRWRTYRNQQARQRIDPYELSIAGDGKPTSVPPELVAILGDSRLKHWNLTWGVKLLDGEQVITSSTDQTLRIWNAKTGRQLHRFDGLSIAASGDRKLAFLAARDGKIDCWDAAAAKVVKTLPRPNTAPQYVNMAANLDGSTIVAQYQAPDRSRQIIVWDVLQERPRHSFQPAFTDPGGLAVTKDGQTFTWASEGIIQVTDSATGKIVRTMGPFLHGSTPHEIGQVALAEGEGWFFVGSSADEVVVFEWATGYEKRRIGPAAGSGYQFALGQSDRALLFGGQKSLTVWPIWSAAPRHLDGGAVTLGHYRGVDWIEQTVAANLEHEVTLWHCNTTLSSPSPQRLQGGPTSAIRCLAFHPDGKRLFTGNSAGEIVVWQVATWQKLKSWPAHEQPIDALVISHDGTRFATSAHGETIVVWDATTAQEVCSLPSHRDRGYLGISPDGTELATDTPGRNYSDRFSIYSASSGKNVRQSGAIAGALCSNPVWSPDGKHLAFLDGSHGIALYDTLAQIALPSVGKVEWSAEPFAAVWFSDNKRLITAGWGHDEVHLLEVGKAKPVATLNTGGGQLRCVALHPSEQFIAVCGRACPVQLWHLPTAKLVKSWQVGPAQGIVSQVAFSPNGHYLATGNGNGTAYVVSLDGVVNP